MASFSRRLTSRGPLCSLFSIFSSSWSLSCWFMSSMNEMPLLLLPSIYKQTKFQILYFLLITCTSLQPLKEGSQCLSFSLFYFYMQSNYTNNLLRYSHGFQKTQPLSGRSPNNKGFPMPQNLHHTHPHPETQTNSIKQQESKIECFETLMKKKNVQQVQANGHHPFGTSKHETNEAKSRPQFPMPSHQQPLTDQILRGSCQNILQKFDYSNLRNTTHFNPSQKRNTHNQIRRSPKEEIKSLHINRAYTQEYPANLQRNDNRTLQCHTSFLSPSRTPSTTIERDGQETHRTPVKYKSPLEANKTSILGKCSPESADRSKFKSLNEIIQIKNREKLVADAKKAKKSSITNQFEFSRSLGKGKFGEVFLARHHFCGFIAAIKKIEKKKVIQYKMVDQFVKQIRLHASLDHSNIVKFYGVFEDKEAIYLVMEYMNGGTLFDYLNEVPYMDVHVAVLFLKDVIEALHYMHDKSIAHRDIKPENIVINSEGVAKLCDFGWSAIVETSRKTYCGTFDYAPPEILERKNYDTSVDIWCIGVLTYELLTGRVPFEGQKRTDIMQKIVNVDKHKLDYPVNIPLEAKEFIEDLVQKEPSLRPRCQDLLKYSLFTKFLPKASKPKRMP